MSNVIDQKVVEMRFDNKQFENNVQTSLSTLDRLKKSLNLEGATKGLENVDAASKKLNFSGLSSAVETVQAKFSAFEVMAVTALANITNSAINAGKQMLRSLTIEPVSQGFNEYELKMGSIQTIMASTGASLKEVNGYGARITTPNTVRSRSLPMASCRQSTKRSSTDSAQLPLTHSRAILPRCTVTRVLSQTLQSCLPPVRWRATSMTSRLRPPMALPARTLRGTAQPGMRSAVRSRLKNAPTQRSTRYSQTLPLDEVMLYEMGIASAVELRIVENRGPLFAALSFPYASLYWRLG